MQKTLITALLCLIALGALPAAASASRGQVAVFEDTRLLLERGGGPRDATLDELRGLGVDVIKFKIAWSALAPGGRTKPRGFDGSDPAAYPAANWGRYDDLVRESQARGFRVMVAPTSPAPGWATRKKGDSSGVDRPSPREYGRFVKAIGKRYPSVNLWTFWNEPNHPGWLYPQATRSRVPYAPHLYRSLVRSGVAGLRASGHSGDRILFGELLPIGKSRVFRKNTLKPLHFLREFFCLDSRYRAFRGRAAKARGCRGYRKLTGLNGFAYHPYTRTGGPRVVEPSRSDATIRSISRVTRVLDLARRKGRISGRKLSVWNTEFDYQSDPPDKSGFAARLSKIPGFMSEAEWLSYRHSRVASWSQYTMLDDPLGSGADRYGAWQGGLRFADGRPKPGVYDAYRMPLFVRLLGPSAVEVWGAARPAGPGSSVQIQERLGGGFRALGGPTTISNSRGYFSRRFRISKASRRSFRVSFTSGGRTFTSRTARAASR